MASLRYARVSTVEQNLNLQIRALTEAGCLKTYTDHGTSGTKAERPELDNLLDHPRPDDELMVRKPDRLDRNTRQVFDLVDHLKSAGIHFQSLTAVIATTGPMGKTMLARMSAFAQLQRDQVAERTKAGMATAAARDRKGCRPGITPETEKVRQVGQYLHAKLS